MTYEEALTYLEGRSSFGIQPGLDRIRALMDYLGHPERAYRIVHVTGTNGKGSVTAFLGYALASNGLKVGRFISPHLETYRERFLIGTQMISEEEFGRLMGRIKEAVDALCAQGLEAPTQFEILTAAAFLYFKEEGVDYAVIEVGLGGLLDSTNVIEQPVLTIITNVSIDHTAYCGSTLTSIAKHKAGIIKPTIPIVTAAEGEALRVIREEALAKGARLFVYGDDFEVTGRHLEGAVQVIRVDTRDVESISDLVATYPDMVLRTHLMGQHQAKNLACAWMALEILMAKDDRLSVDNCRAGIHQTSWPGRFELVSLGGRTLILDGAHNAGGAASFRDTYKDLFSSKPKTLIMAVLGDKDDAAIVESIVNAQDRIYTIEAPTPRSMTAQELADHIGQHAKPMASMAEALTAAMKVTQEGDVIAVCGSLYILGWAREWIRQNGGHESA